MNQQTVVGVRAQCLKFGHSRLDVCTFDGFVRGVLKIFGVRFVATGLLGSDNVSYFTFVGTYISSTTAVLRGYDPSPELEMDIPDLGVA